MTEMSYRPLGSSGLMVSAVGLGCNNFGRVCDLEQTRAVIDAAQDAGITLLDTADIYGGQGASEALLGEVLKGRRDEFVLATKFGMDMGGANGADFGARGSRRYIRRAVEASLTRLQTDHIDLYQYHVPDGVTPIEETLAALHELVVEGKVRYIGSSNFAGWQVVEAALTATSNGWTPFVSAQNHYSLLARQVEGEVIPACEAYGVGMLPFFPLANGLLTGKAKRGEAPPEGSRLTVKTDMLSDANFDVVERLTAVAESHGVALLDVAIGGLAAQPAVASVIAGATKPEQVVANARAGRWEPDAAALAAIDGAAPAPAPAYR